ncbi:hypothetical protein F5Y19DRAFT_471878 [Xylariaceae sp. FL1651]|nr:hypothetical protein F5Y19DRAFT_471878 [Xylariaceae sp. FL1651]
MASTGPPYAISTHLPASPIQVEEIENWFKSDGPGIHHAYGEETYWRGDQGRFVSGKEPPVQVLKNMLVLYKSPINGAISSPTGHLDLCQCSWDDVLTQLEIARASCLIKDRKTSRKADRFLAKAASYGEKWIELLPDEYGLSVVRGGLALVFSSATQKIENREKIIHTFEDLPDMIRTLETACKLFGSDEEEDVCGLAKSFYDELCSDIPDLIQILDGKSSRFNRFLNRLAAGAPETAKIDEVLERVGRRASKLESSIKRIKMRLDAKEQSEIVAIRSKLEATQMGMGLIYSEVKQLPNRLDMVDFARNFQQTIVKTVRDELQSSVQEILKNQTKGDFAAEAKTFVFKMIQENTSLKHENAQLSAQNKQIEYERSRRASPVPRPFLTTFDLMRILDVDPKCLTEDLGFVLKQAFRMGPEDQGRARWLMKTKNFLNWMNRPQHYLLLADGAMQLERISSMSVLVGTLAISLLQVPSTVVIYFFCGRNLNTDAEDELAGPNGMLRSLITQLLLGFTPPSPDLSGISSHEFLLDCYKQDFSALCEVLKLLIEQIAPGATLYCLLDGVSWYEQKHWARELRYLVGLFKHMTMRPGGPCLKVFMTSPSRSTDIRDLFDTEWEYVSLAAGNVDCMPLVSPSILAAASPHP